MRRFLDRVPRRGSSFRHGGGPVLFDRRRSPDGARRAWLGARSGLQRRSDRPGGHARRGADRAGAPTGGGRFAARSRHAGHGWPYRPCAVALGSPSCPDHHRFGGTRAGRRSPRLRVRRLGLYRQVGLAGRNCQDRARRPRRRDFRAAGGRSRRLLRPARDAAHTAAMARARPYGPGRPEQADRPQARCRRGDGEGARDGDPAQARRTLAHPGGNRGARSRAAAGRTGKTIGSDRRRQAVSRPPVAGLRSRSNARSDAGFTGLCSNST